MRNSRCQRQGALLLVFLAFLAGCAGPRPSPHAVEPLDPEYARLSHLARAAFDQRNLLQAEAFYRQAHRRARALDAPAEIADATYNLAAVLISQRKIEAAQPFLDEAEAAFARTGEAPVDIWLVRAQLALAEGQPLKARRWLDETHAAPLTPTQQLQVALLRGAAARAEGDLAEAGRQLVLAREIQTNPSPSLRGDIEAHAGTLALLENRPAEAATAFDREADFRRAARDSRRLAQALENAGEAYAAAHDTTAGAERAYRAARVLLALDEVEPARRLIEQGTEWAAETDDPSLLASLVRLATEASTATHTLPR